MQLRNNGKSELFEDVTRWFNLSAGQRLVQSERTALLHSESHCYGKSVLIVGGGEVFSECFTSDSKVDNVSFLNPILEVKSKQVIQGSLVSWPIRTQTVDCLFIHHMHEFYYQPHQLLREASRVLMPGGRLIIAGFCSLSLWSIWRFFVRKHKPARVMHYCSTGKLRDWLRLLNFDSDRPVYLLSGFPFDRLFANLGRRSLDALTCWGRGSAYLSIAIKEEVGLTPLNFFLNGEEKDSDLAIISPICKVDNMNTMR